MKREGNLETLTDGKLYRSSDMVRLGCQDCEGCSACCRGMGNSVVLDPYDVWRLEQALHKSFAEMVGKELILSVIDGLILPSLNMEATGECPFLNEEGRCSIHTFRPGICRLFPLGRYYHDDGFSYVLMQEECKKENRTKVKIEKWLGEDNLPLYEKYVLYFKKLKEQARQEMITVTQQYGAETAMAEQKKISLAFLGHYDRKIPHNASFLQSFMGEQ